MCLSNRPAIRVTFAAILLIALATPHVAAQTADQVRNATEISGGLVVTLGTNDGALEGDLAGNPRLLIQGLTTDADACAAARRHLFAKGVYGQAAVDQVPSLKTLPFYDRMVNLVVADLDAQGDDAPSLAEINRVLGYEGIAYVKQDGKWAKHVRPMPEDVAEFTHYHYDATRSNLSPDERVGPPNALRWVGKPSDHNGYLGVRVGKGVTFVRSGTGSGNKSPEGRIRLPMLIVAKDAHSGVTLWNKKQTGYRGWDRSLEWGVVGHDHLFVYTRATSSEKWGDARYLEYAIEAWDIQTGETKHRWVLGNARGEEKEKRFLDDYFPQSAIMAATDGKFAYNLGPEMVVREQKSGELLWKNKPVEKHGWIKRFIIADGLVIALVRENNLDKKYGTWRSQAPFVSLVAWSLEDGKEVWRHDGAGLWKGFDFDPNGVATVNELTGYRDGLLPLIVWDRNNKSRRGKGQPGSLVMLLDVRTGKRLWATPTRKIDGSWGVIDCYIRGDQLHVAKLTSIQESFDLKTGEKTTAAAWGSSPRSSNCCSGTATAQYLVMQRNYIPWDAIAEYQADNSIKTPDLYYTRLVSFACRSKISPAYGTTFMPSGSCNCTAFLPGSFALYGVPEVRELPDDQRRGSEYPGATAGHLPRQAKAMQSAIAFDWKLRPDRTGMTWSAPRTGRQSNRASGSTESWGYGQHETEPIRVGDLTIKAYVDEHRVEAKRGDEVVWNYIAGGRIGFRQPIQADDQRIYFASHDGYIYAVNHADGSLGWRVLAAPADKRMVAFGQVESAWPLFNVVLHEGKVYGCAGRHQELDGGLHFYSIDAESGEIDWHVKRRFGIADADHEGAIHGAWQSRSNRWKRSPGRPKADEDWTHSSQWALNGKLLVKDGKLVMTPEAWKPFEMDLKNPRDVVVNKHTLIPPGVEENPGETGTN